ncbi:MAG: Mov34/MPN/PAD-1 family protein [Myxococcales bacterium]|nr:Mov34/MPN/PAD-1 family protein [Myxococcales bacterium]MCB9708592.1 Mov34/MPN/PAD-1 family protein [Myxococcales bacterium]
MSGETPWIHGNLTLPRSVMTAIEEEAVRAYPSECCGFLSGPLEQPLLVDEAIFEVNEADKYHALDPERFPRTSKTYFKINALRAARRFEEGNATGRPIKVIYHSHCDAGAYFSEEDAATFAAHGQLMWPCAFLVMSVLGGNIVDRKLWVHVAGSNGFTESVMQVL